LGKLAQWGVPLNKNKLSYRTVTAQHAMSVEILSSAAQLYEKSHIKMLAAGE